MSIWMKVLWCIYTHVVRVTMEIIRNVNKHFKICINPHESLKALVKSKEKYISTVHRGGRVIDNISWSQYYQFCSLLYLYISTSTYTYIFRTKIDVIYGWFVTEETRGIEDIEDIKVLHKSFYFGFYHVVIR